MGEIVQFEIGCRHCEHLSKIDNNTWVCMQRVHMDDSDVVPIKNGKKTDDWGICDGEAYVRTFNAHLHSN